MNYYFSLVLIQIGLFSVLNLVSSDESNILPNEEWFINSFFLKYSNNSNKDLIQKEGKEKIY